MTTNYANYANAYCNVIRVICVIRSAILVVDELTSEQVACEKGERVKRLICYYVFLKSVLMSFWLTSHRKVKLLLCLSPSDLMSLCLLLSLPQNKLTCYYVFSYPVHQHHTCGASTQQSKTVRRTNL